MIGNPLEVSDDAFSKIPALIRGTTARPIAHYAIQLLRLRTRPIPSAELTRRAMVFSPHPDDECLGCGGTILRKREAGADITLVHMTDGSGSHAHAMPKRELAGLRRHEAERAADALGVKETFFLDFEDGRLSDCIDEGVLRVLALLRKKEPQEIFVPSRLEPRRQAADHLATTDIVRRAARAWGQPVTVFEYPVWFWLHWPWVRLRQKGCSPIKTRHVGRNSLKMAGSLRAWSEFNCLVDISSMRQQKIAALAEHRSQLVELLPEAQWATLGQVSRGEFLSCFLTDVEFFRRYVL